jgi:TPR repeat protein
MHKSTFLLGTLIAALALLSLTIAQHATTEDHIDAMLAMAQELEQDDDDAAADWYRCAADAGSPDAMLALGIMHSEGRGVLQSEALALQWYTRAAQAGLSAAQFNLGYLLIHAESDEVQRDRQAGMSWIEKAARGGDPDALALLVP